MTEKKIESWVATLIGFGVMLVLGFTLLPAILWYCIDDTLAELVGVAELGRLPFWFVFPSLMLLGTFVRPVYSDRQGD